MNCPRCNTKIGENDLVCPECKKVLRLKCPVCGAVTKNTVCEKCGSVIINKCYKCGKLNSTAQDTCPKCGMDINASIGLRESFIEEFAALTIEITNFEELKNALKSDKLTQKFKKNLYEMIKKTAMQKKLRVQFLQDTFIIRFCKDYSFLESAKSALDFSIYIAQTVSEINKKLFDAKGIELKVQMAVQKRDVYSKPSEYKSGLNINVVYSSNANAHRFHNTEVVVDSYIYQVLKLQYPFQSLSAVYVKNQMVMFFELVLHQIIKPEQEELPESNNIKLPKNIDFEPDEEIEDEQLINFSSLNCTFRRVKQSALIKEIEKFAAKNIQNPIVSIRSEERLGKLSLISKEEIQRIFPDYNAVRFSCPKNNKYIAFGLFKQMILAYRGLDEISILTNPELIDSVSADEAVRDLFKMHIEAKVHPEDLRYTYFEAFTKFISAIPQKTLFIIDDFENTDEGSLDIIKYLCDNKSLSNVGFVISCSEDYALHRRIYKLMTSANYLEIELKPSSNKSILTENIEKLKEVKDSFFIEKVLENTKGSYFYFEQALKYLTNDNVLEIKDGIYTISAEKMIVIPQDLNELIQRRIQRLQTKQNAFELYGSLLLTGEKLPVSTVAQTEIKDGIKLLKYMEKQEFIRIINDKEIIINNYNLYKDCFIAVCEKEKLEEISKNLLEKIYINIPISNTTKAMLLEYAKLKKEAFSHWHALAMVSGQIGDFSAYLNCTNKFLSLVDNVIDTDTDKTVEQVKLDVYAELASMMYKYYPDKILNFLQTLLENLEEQNDDKKIKEVANKLVQSCLISGNYNNALEYAGKILSRTKRSSFNPQDKDFNLNYFLVNLVTLEIYFNLGRLNECIDLGEELFRYIDFSNASEVILPEGFSKKQFDDALLDAVFFVCASQVIQQKSDAVEKITALINRIPQKYACLKLLIILQQFLHGDDITQNLKQIVNDGLNDKYSKILLPVIEGFIAWKNQDWVNFGNNIYNAKIKASILQLHQAEYFCDLMIGLAYRNLGNIKKAKQIFYDILNLSEEKGLKNITYTCWYIISKTEFTDDNEEMAFGLLNNSVLNIESNPNISPIFIMLFKMISAEFLLKLNKNPEQALFCAQQAFDIAQKTDLKIYLAPIAQMLLHIYNVLIKTQNDSSKVNEIQTKINTLTERLSQFNK